MTDDSTSRSTEDGESADGDGRASDTEAMAPGDEGAAARASEETTDSPAEETTEAGQPTDASPTDESSADDPPAEEVTVAGNHMAGVEPDAEDADSGDSDARDAPDVEDTPGAGDTPDEDEQPSPADFVPEDVRKYERFKKMDGARYDRANEFLRDRTYITAREWAIARLCSDFRTETGVEMTKIGENLPRLVPFMEDTYTPQAVNQARHSFEEKVRKSGATFLYGAMSGFFTAEQLDDVMYEITEVAKFLLEVEGVDLSVEEELEAEDRILSVMREVREQSEQLRHEGVTCPECGHEIGPEGDD